MKNEIEDEKYPASIYYNSTPAETSFNTPVPIFQNREKRRGNFTHTQVQSQAFTQVGCSVCMQKKKKPSALLETSSPTRFQRQKLFGEKFPAHPSVSSQT